MQPQHTTSKYYGSRPISEQRSVYEAGNTLVAAAHQRIVDVKEHP
jgi:hypothetical protein